MVNTFLVDQDFRVSASKLDRQRLGKQRVEAYQALLLIKQYRFLAKYLGIPDFPIGVDTTKDMRRGWVNNVVNTMKITFKSKGLTAIHVRGKLAIHYKLGDVLPKRIESGNKIKYDSTTGLIYETKGVKEKLVASGTTNQFILPGDIFITSKIRIHPAIDMWLGFEDALKDYINAHIEAWIARGYNNTMETYQVPANYARPKWTYSPTIFNNYKAVLLQKEIDRLEPAWYLKQDDFIDVWGNSNETKTYIKKIIKTIPSDNFLDYLPEEHKTYVKGEITRLSDKWLKSQSKEYQTYIQQVIKSMPSSNWWDYLPQRIALTLGRAPEFEWA